ncbi:MULTISPECIES: SDR family oxidoreductase [Pseudonocardia]|uniref:Levodione reductase n=2 Tax=Pseudonocardia TaxID=1847 RepID=A0A1Y2MWU1_PSEAH|nr:MULTISPECIES: SDR family oxidoreductase [Pseudonocardia]OSY39297.1 Levodione reductase [Pseudonocardia autotrophica]TDN76481.1 NADP-dependent 3-hydroxy acid dehydrogenase YdfG [Pseudonocardia autotrophica]GEC29553.1 dehydrogenase [Pseudonocardia saturnea]
MDLSGKVALVTGGASGIGAAAVDRLVAAGAQVVVVDLDGAGAAAVAGRSGGFALQADVTDPAAMPAAVAAAEERFGRLDVVLLNAGITGRQTGVENLDVAGYRQIVGVNLDHVVFGLTAAVPALRRAGGGNIVATSSLAGLVPLPGDALYAATKHAVVGYVRSAAETLVADGIRVNAVCPGYADTPLIAEVREQFGDFPMLSADDVAAAVEQILDRGEPGECWFVQPGREPAPYGFRGVPSPRGAGRPPEVGLHGSGSGTGG